MAAASWQQQALLDDLLESIQLDPSAIESRRLLAQQYEALGWDEAAADVTMTILSLQADEGPSNRSAPARPRPVYSGPPPSHTVKQLGEECQNLRNEAKNLLQELLIFQELAPSINCADQIADLTALAEGRMFSVARGRRDSMSMGHLKPPPSARMLASAIKAGPRNALDIAFADLKGLVEWIRATGTNAKSKDETDTIRDALRKRVEAVKPFLSVDTAYAASDAFMHIEHEVLHRSYANAETMYTNPVSDIEREMFWTSEDGYAWDTSELVQAIKANKGAMRNPLSRENFTVADVEAIVRHPIGRELAAIQVEQSQLFQGVRRETTTRLQALAKILLHDDTENSHPSHAAVDDFLSYVATLPDTERKAINRLRVPAVDSHTGQPFDDTIGDAVRDAKGNRICFHKAGDLLQQATVYLSGNSRF